jgi:adenosine kinase
VKDIVVTGSIAYDYLMRFPGRFREHLLAENIGHLSISFLVDDMTRHWGGNGANIAFSMALLGMRPRLLGTAGIDFSNYKEWLESAGVDTSLVVVIENLFTASFFANTDLDNNQIASFYAGAMLVAHKYPLSEMCAEKMPEYLVISPNDPLAMDSLAQECAKFNVPYMYDPSQQLPRLDGETLWRAVQHCHTLVVNEYEWGMLEKKMGKTIGDVTDRVKVLIRTLGKKGAEIYTEGKHYHIPVFPVPDEHIADPTGVGDAFRSGILCGMAHGWNWEITGRVASLCAAYVLERVGTQSHRYGPREFVARYRTAFDDEGALDSLLNMEKVGE